MFSLPMAGIHTADREKYYLQWQSRWSGIWRENLPHWPIKEGALHVNNACCGRLPDFPRATASLGSSAEQKGRARGFGGGDGGRVSGRWSISQLCGVDCEAI